MSLVQHVTRMNRCKVCTAPVLNSKERRTLSSITSKSCREVLTGLAVESGAEMNIASQEYSSGYLCKLCFNTVAKYSALREQVKNMRVNLLSKISSTSTTGPDNRGTKRKSDAAVKGVKVIR